MFNRRVISRVKSFNSFAVVLVLTSASGASSFPNCRKPSRARFGVCTCEAWKCHRVKTGDPTSIGKMIFQTCDSKIAMTHHRIDSAAKLSGPEKRRSRPHEIRREKELV